MHELLPPYTGGRSALAERPSTRHACGLPQPLGIGAVEASSMARVWERHGVFCGCKRHSPHRAAPNPTHTWRSRCNPHRRGEEFPAMLEYQYPIALDTVRWGPTIHIRGTDASPCSAFKKSSPAKVLPSCSRCAWGQLLFLKADRKSWCPHSATASRSSWCTGQQSTRHWPHLPRISP